MKSSIETYRTELAASCVGGKGIPDIVSQVPAIFDTLEQLIRDPDLTNQQRTLVFAALGYFFVPDDLFPEEELGQVGYIDDIILSLCILNEIRLDVQGKNAIKRHWKLTIEVEDAFGTHLSQLIKDYPLEYTTVLSHFGLLPDTPDGPI